MQNKNHQINQHDKGLCHICGTKLENGVCAICGWTQIIFPSEVPTEIIEFNKQREKVAQNLHKEVCELKDTLKKLEKTSEEVSEYQQSLKKANAEAQTAKQEKERYKSDKESAEKKLKDEQTAHNRSKQQVKELQEKIERLSIEKTPVSQPSVHPQIKQPAQTITQRTVIGKVIFTSGGRTESVELYSGLCRVTAPQWTNMGGELFEINGSNGLYRLFDIKGNICDRHGKPIPPQGTTTRNNDVFTSGNVTIRFTLPEIDYDSLY